MKGNLGRMAAAVIGVSVLASAAAAQVLNNPVYVSPKHGVGLTINGDIGFGVNDDAKPTGETPLAYGGHASLGLGIVTVTAGASLVDLKGGADKEVGFGGNVALNVFKAPAMPVAVSVFGGAGTISFSGTSSSSFVGGAAVGVAPPLTGASLELWAAPRVHISKVEGFDSETGFGASGGVNLGLPMGLGLHVAADWITIGDPSVKPLVLGAGAHYKFTIPGLGGM